MNRRFLLLQGPVGPFFDHLYKSLQNAGHYAMRVNFNNGDAYFNSAEHSVNFCGEMEKWPEFLKNLLVTLNFTDVIMYGDCRFIHKVAIEECNELKIKYHLLEEGYLRPYWVTYEQVGLNAYSDVPRNKNFYSSFDVAKDPPCQRFTNTTLSIGIYSIIYYFAYIKHSSKKFKNYSHHSQIDYKSVWYNWILRVLSLPLRHIDAKIKKQYLKNKSFFLVPLQLDRDSQITTHSDFSDMEEFSRKVMESFKKNASENDMLVFKNHPLDCGSRKMKLVVTKAAKELGLAEKVVFIDAGKLPYLLSYAKGVITINSTAGISAIIHNKKLITLGDALYDFEGITYQGNLDDFWLDDFKPNIGLFQKFRYYLLENKQLNGCYYSAKGKDILIRNLMHKLSCWHTKDNVVRADFRKAKPTYLKFK